MSSHTRPRLTAGEISVLVGAFPLVAGTILAFILTSSWLQWRDGSLLGGRSLRRNAVASFGTIVGLLNPRQLRALLSHTTGQAVEEYCAAADLPHRSVLVANDDGFPPARLHFIGCDLEHSGPILLYFHGGGFIVPLASPAFAIWMARKAGASPVILEYTLAPECVYPGQLAQAVAALRLILQHRKPSDVILAGESAGGNIALAVMAHLQQPREGISPLVLSTPPVGGASFRGVLAISPRTANVSTAPSFKYNAGKDFMSRGSLAAITATWKPEHDVWAAPVLAKAGFWDGLKAERVLLAAGGNEVYRDDICHVAKVVGANQVDVREMEVKGEVEKGYNPRLQLIVCPGEMHCQASLDMSLGIADGYMTTGIAQWLSRFQHR